MVPSGRGSLELNKLEQGLPLETRLQVKFCRKGHGGGRTHGEEGHMGGRAHGEEGHMVEDLQERLH